MVLLASGLVSLAPSALRAEPPRTSVAVLELIVDGGADPVIGRQLTARIAELIGQRPGHSVIAPDDIRAMLAQEQQKQLLGCTDDGCLVEIVGALGVDRLVSGRVSKLDGAFALSLSLIDARSSRALGHANERWGGESMALLELVRPMLARLFGAGADAAVTGAIEVTGAPDGARILVDDQVRGTAPAGQLGGIPAGAHRVQVVDDDHLPIEQWVVVQAGAVTTVAVRAERASPPVYATWWFWTGVAVVAGAGLTTALVLGAGDDPSGGATGVRVSVDVDRALGGR